MSVRIAAIPLLALTLGACTYDPGPDRYSRREIGAIQEVQYGVLDSYRYVELDTSTGVGTATGVAAGAALGSTVGNGAEGFLGAIAGALIGGALGKSADRSVGRHDAFEYTILLDNGHNIAILQADETPIPPGSPVVVQMGSRQSRVFIDNSRIAYQEPPAEPQ